MEKQALPNSTAVLVLGILSIITCCCYGVVGLILGILAVYLANKDLSLYQENPENYTGYSNLNTGKILGIIGIVLSTCYLISTLYFYFAIGEEGMKQMTEQFINQMKNRK